jgi:hypothetical protein
MMPPDGKSEYIKEAPVGITLAGLRLLHTRGEAGVEVIDSGLTSTRKKGEAMLAANKKHAPHIFKKKNCIKCKERFQPTSGNSQFCDKCKPLTREQTDRARKALEEQQNPVKRPGPKLKNVSKIELEKLASGLITEHMDMTKVDFKEKVYYAAGLSMLKKQATHDADIAGCWVHVKAGETADGRHFVESKEIITGAICLDLWCPRERFLSQL